VTGLVPLLSFVWTGLFGYLSWMWAAVVASLTGTGVWLVEGPMLLLVFTAGLAWIAGAWRETWVIQNQMASRTATSA